MATIKISELTALDVESNLQELSEQECEALVGGRIKLKTVTYPGLSTPDGDPVAVYVDGILVNDVATGYYGGY